MLIKGRRSSDLRRERLWVGPVLLLVTAMALLAIIYASLQVQSGVRAYVGGEGLYSKGQKDAVFHLLRYADTRNDAEYQAYLTSIAIPRGDKTARIELEKANPDLGVAASGFAQGHNNEADISVLITTFRTFRHVSYIDQAIAIWTEGDTRIDELVALGDKLHALIGSGSATTAQIEPLVGQVGQLNGELTALEDRFSAVLSEGARWIRDVLFIVASLATALLLVISGGALMSSLRRIRRSEDRYRQLLAAAPDAILVADPEGRIVLFNEAAERIVGGPSAAAIGRPVTSIVDLPRDGAGAAGHDGGAGRGPVELEATRADGSTFWAEATVADLGIGPKPGTTVIFRDVTERRAAQDALRESRERLSFALDAGRMGTWDWEVATGQMHWSESLERIVGIPPGSFGGTYDAFVELVDPEDREQVRLAFERAAASDGEYVVECRMGPPGAPAALIAAQGRMVRNAAGSPIRLVGVALDITARHELEEQLRHAQKMESVGRLAGGIAHDFNNLLTAITGHGELLTQAMAEDDERQADVAAINAAAARAATLTRQLLAYGRQTLLRPEPVDLNRVVSSIEPMLHRLIGEDVRLRTELADDLGWVRADAGQLDQVILNLVVNARDAMPDGGTIVLATDNADLDDGYLAEHPEAHGGRHVSIAVKDTGIGIDPATRGRIFEPYFTTKDRGRGTGLGLATVFGIV
ncbi:MAG: two-component system, cell cycle sensor histidine kinase and response regulator CckA, partial [Chloroflexota bacterium]|nr:two-component system, cell cycle sensor histidine kinase and response regulator CckA [Chloroflexota bacterium]